ncbi:MULTISPECIES: type I-E CRISPR-associated protein Cas5/CasD [Marinomonas]|uniref:Type I-E CRISPR-associated protein Cas5/CasD n=1 Tax=Marinomonas rhodophyticola TaxID=2992803 RepID=A0ABT3KFH2_9GAMM|nr:type I-E CRISPR-associated protein Cas5/CasD [Marinomonas sp. KJ51-3]MCW4629273.1 type I-E CRISPR-associated protein Cas5/CasD [Marinomonas sp. KJ51-3]
MMGQYLILRLSGPMQAWGQPSFEGTRPSAAFPTRSGLLGLLGACLGIRRNDRKALQELSNGVRFAIRCEQKNIEGKVIKVTKLTDYHTVKDARESYQGLKSHETIQTWREYLCDATFTLAVWTVESSTVSLEQLALAVKKPVFTPYLGRRSCPLSEPLYLSEVEAEKPLDALNLHPPIEGIVYSEIANTEYDGRVSVRDEPIINLPRQFATREWFIVQGGIGNVSK